MKCPRCQFISEANSVFCAQCGFDFRLIPSAQMQNKSNLQTVLIVLGSLFGACVLCGLLGAIQEQINPPKKSEMISNSAVNSNIRTLVSTPSPPVSLIKGNSNHLTNNSRINSNVMQNSLAEQKLSVQEKPKVIQEKSSYYIRGPRGGCYYLSASGRKQYVDRSLCN